MWMMKLYLIIFKHQHYYIKKAACYKAKINGICKINHGSPFSVPSNCMASGSLTIGGTNADYGTGGSQWTANTTGFI